MPAERGPRFKTSWAKGFKLPSFYSLANPSVGNPSLQPERAKSFDAGIEHGTRVALSLIYFRNDFRDLVNFDTITFHLMNMSRTLTQGTELGADYAATAQVHFGLDFSYTTWNLFDSTQPLRNVPHGNGGIHLDWKFYKRFRARAETQWMGRRYDYQLPVPNENSVGGYCSTSISANYEMTRKSCYTCAETTCSTANTTSSFDSPIPEWQSGLVCSYTRSQVSCATAVASLPM
jgi:vitamin B12 transporter